MKKILIVFFLSSVNSTFSQISNVTGASTNTIEGLVWPNSITSTSFTNDYTAVTGYFTGTIGGQFGPNVLPISSVGEEDVYIQMLYDDDFFNWTRVIGGNGEDRGVEVLKDEENLYIAGVFSETVDFDPNSGVEQRTSKGGTDVFLLCLDRASSNFKWVKVFGGHGDDDVTAMDWYYENGERSNLYLTGTFEGRADFLPGKLRHEEISNGGKDCYVNCFTPNGLWQWVKTWGGLNDDKAYDIFTEKTIGSNLVDVAVCGNFSSTVDFDPGAGVFNMFTTNNAGFVMKLNDIGNFVWAKKIDSPNSTGGILLSSRTVTMDKEGNVYHAGIFDTQVDFDPGPGTAINTPTTAFMYSYLSKLDDNGNFDWVRPFSAAGGECFPWDSDVAEGTANKVYVIGYLNQNSDFDPNISGSGELIGTGTFVVRHNLQGDFNWAKQIKNAQDAGGGYSIETHPNGCQVRMSLCGDYGDHSSLDIDPDAPTFYIQDNFSPSDGTSGYSARWFDDACEAKNVDENQILIFPNPSADGVAEVHLSESERITDIQVLNTSGAKVKSKTDVRASQGRIALKNVQPGIYIVVITTNNKVINVKWNVL